jgi:hypothetical protein
MNQRREEEHLLEIANLSFPRKDRMLGFLKGASCGISSHPLGACLEHLPDHADRSFQACHEGLFRLGKVARTARTFVNDTAIMMLCGIGRMRLKDSRLARWALDL